MLVGLMTSKSGGMVEKLVKLLPQHHFIVFTNNPNNKLTERCKKLSLSLVYITDDKFYSNKDNDAIDLFILLGFMKILPKDFVINNKVINYHPGLEDLRGKDPVERALKQYKQGKRKKTGGMLHYVDLGVDTGKIIYKFEVLILRNDTYNTLTDRMENIAIKLLVHHLQ